jgi:CMP-N,N'-diacetyllegionaminic acid synthase
MDASQLLIIIPARGGSKGLPGKNTKTLGGYPLLKWTSDAVALSGLKNYQCILSTDDAEIAAIGKDIGLDTPFLRPTELASDTANTVDAVFHAINWLKTNRNFQPEYLMLLQPTSPFRSPQVIHEAFKLLTENDIDAVIGVKPIHRTLGTLFYAIEENTLSALEKQANLTTRRQDVRTLYTPNGAMYLIKSETLKTQKVFFPENSKAIIMDQIQSHDIDDPIDWAIATAYINARLSWRTRDSGKTP